MNKILSFAKTPTEDCSKLSYIFKDQPNLAWDMLEQECNLYTLPNIDVEEVNKLTSMYGKIVVKLNELQDARQKYFTNKMQKLMAQPFIIRCYTECTQKKTTNINLIQKRKELEQKLSLQSEKQNSQAFFHYIQSHNQKQKKLKQKINDVIQQHQKNLETRLQLRLMKKSTISPIKKKSQDSMANSSTQLGNPEFMTPTKSEIFQELRFLDLRKLKNKPEHHSYRPQSQRIFNNHRFDETNSDSDDSEDEYRIQKMLKQQKIHMAKKQHAALFQQNPRQHRQ